MASPRALPLLLALAGVLAALSSASPGDGVRAVQSAHMTGRALAVGAVGEAAVHQFSAAADGDGTSAGSRGGARMLFPRMPRKFRSNAVTDLNCNRTGSRVTCFFCNLLPTAIQNVVLTYTSTLSGTQAQFDGTDRININKDGNLPIYLKPDDCTKFSYKSNQILMPSVLLGGVGGFSCLDALAPGSFDGFNAISFGTCFVTKQTTPLSSGASGLTCDVTCRLVNFGPTAAKPTVDCPPYPPYTSTFGGFRYNGNSDSCMLDRTVGFGESDPFGYTFKFDPNLTPPSL